MSQRARWLAAALLVGAAAIAVATFAQSDESGETVRVAVVEKRAVTHKVLAQGKVRARTQVEVASEIGGRVKDVAVVVGDVVVVGAPLFQLDDEQLRNAVEQLRVALAGAEALKKRADLGVQEADRGVARDQALRDKGVVALEQLRISESRAQLARAELDSASAQLERTRLDLGRAKDALRRARVTAPIGGTVVAVGVEKGQVVSAVQGLAGDGMSGFAGLGGTSTGPSAPVIIAELSELIVKLDVDELDVGLVAVGQRAQLTAQGLKDVALSGIVERVGLMGREQAGAVLFTVEIAVDGPGGGNGANGATGANGADAGVRDTADVGTRAHGSSLLRPGMSVQADIEVQRIDGALAIPVAAVLEGDGADKPDRVFVLDEAATEGGVVSERRVKLGPTEGERIAIVDGLKEGERVVSGPFRSLKSLTNGARVRVERDVADAGPSFGASSASNASGSSGR